MENEKQLTKQGASAGLIENVVLGGDLSSLPPAQRVEYYRVVCESLSLNPFTKPFNYLNLQGRLTLYANKDCAEQLRARDGISIDGVETKQVGDIYIATARATTAEGRTDVSTGAVNTKGLVGDKLANALMKAETKAKRRVTLSICGLGWLDETEIETIPDASIVEVDDAGEIVGEKPQAKAPTPEPKPETSKRELETDALLSIAQQKDLRAKLQEYAASLDPMAWAEIHGWLQSGEPTYGRYIEARERILFALEDQTEMTKEEMFDPASGLPKDYRDGPPMLTNKEIEI